METYTNSLGMEFALIPAGSFIMGVPLDNEGGGGNASPDHRVTISKPFYLSVGRVNCKQWLAVIKDGPDIVEDWGHGYVYPFPVRISWNDIQKFIEGLNKKEGHNRYRLPTEAEWEYAATTGVSSKRGLLYSYDYVSTGIQPFDGKPNSWGLYGMYDDMEWVQDWYDENYYRYSPSVDPRGPSSGSHRVARDTYWGPDNDFFSLTRRFYYSPDDRSLHLMHFRLALSLE
jgi:formylglycine-generating enzyme required for sulfatase activity